MALLGAGQLVNWRQLRLVRLTVAKQRVERERMPEHHIMIDCPDIIVELHHGSAKERREESIHFGCGDSCHRDTGVERPNSGHREGGRSG